MDALFTQRCDRLLPGGYRAFFPPEAPLFRGLTVNTLRLTAQAFSACAPFRIAKSPFSPSSFYLLEEARAGLHPYHHAGVYYVQEPSASAPAALLDVRPGERVLDLCAAPGGKTAQLGAALAGRGLLVANEFVPKRASVLLSNLERMGIPNAVVTNESAERLAAAFPGYFDRILVDAPCSGEGMVPQRAGGAAAAQPTPHRELRLPAARAAGRDCPGPAAWGAARLFHLYLFPRGGRGHGGGVFARSPGVCAGGRGGVVWMRRAYVLLP